MNTRRIKMRQVRIRQQRQLFGEPLPIPPIRFSLEAQEQLRKTLAQWMQSLSKSGKEVGDEQDHR
jgi:hypothetical protein